MKLYLDADFRCHLSGGAGMTEIDTELFDGKCPAYIEGYRYVPPGERWVREDGVMFQGEMITPWKPWEELDDAQRAYERQQLEEANAQNAQLLETMAAMVEEVYESDLAVFESGGEGL